MSKEAMNHAIDVLKDSQDYKMGRAMTVEAVEALEEALAKQEQGEPWKYKLSVSCRSCGFLEAYDMEINPPAPQQRKPLTDEQIKSIWRLAVLEAAIEGNVTTNFARAVEAAHGIKE